MFLSPVVKGTISATPAARNTAGIAERAGRSSGAGMEDGQRTRCPVGRLERAVGLLDRGLVSGREFEVLKRHILAELQSATEVEDEEEDGVACLGAPGEPPGGGSWPGNARSAPSAVRSRRCASKRRVPSGGPCYGAHLGGQRGADEGAHSWWTHDDLFSMHVLQFLDMENALRCREVCSRWKRCVAAVGLEPLESGKSGEEVEAGRQEQQLLRAALRREGELWADEEHARIFRMLSNDLEQQHGLNARMRQILVDWLLELHWNTFVTYLEHSSLVQLAVQLVDRFIARMQVQRSNFQAVGAVAFGMVCASSQYAGLALTERHCSIVHTLYPGDDFRVTKEYLIYMCANAFTQREFDKIENEMMCFLRQAPVIPAASQNKGGSSESRQESARHCDSDLGVGAYVVKAHPRPTDFLPRFIKAAGFDPLSTLSSTTGYTPTRIVIFFLDVILVTFRPAAQSLGDAAML